MAASQAWKLQVIIGPPGVSVGLGAWYQRSEKGCGQMSLEGSKILKAGDGAKGPQRSICQPLGRWPGGCLALEGSYLDASPIWKPSILSGMGLRRLMF